MDDRPLRWTRFRPPLCLGFTLDAPLSATSKVFFSCPVASCLFLVFLSLSFCSTLLMAEAPLKQKCRIDHSRADGLAFAFPLVLTYPSLLYCLLFVRRPRCLYWCTSFGSSARCLDGGGPQGAGELLERRGGVRGRHDRRHGRPLPSSRRGIYVSM